MQVTNHECQHVENGACESCAKPHITKPTHSQVKNFTKFMSSVSFIQIKDYHSNSSEVIAALMLAMKRN